MQQLFELALTALEYVNVEGQNRTIANTIHTLGAVRNHYAKLEKKHDELMKTLLQREKTIKELCAKYDHVQYGE